MLHIALYSDTTYTQNIHVYCYMEADMYNVRIVMRVAHIDMRNTSVNSPAPLTQNQLDSGESNESTRTAALCDLPYTSLHLLITFHELCACASLVPFSCLHKNILGSVTERQISTAVVMCPLA